jgi:hypothetical protein
LALRRRRRPAIRKIKSILIPKEKKRPMAEMKKETLTSAAGIPVADNQNAITAGERGPLVVQDWQLFEKHAHFNRERIPERVVHAKGPAAPPDRALRQGRSRRWRGCGQRDRFAGAAEVIVV